MTRFPRHASVVLAAAALAVSVTACNPPTDKAKSEGKTEEAAKGDAGPQIAGLPTESEPMFAHTLSLVEACGLPLRHVFPYSPREGPPAARVPPMRLAGRFRLRAAGTAMSSVPSTAVNNGLATIPL